ncbi:MAG: LicD family protein [Clostridia bacterium]|nr:LicD family protein [Clostridia bacterium]
MKKISYDESKQIQLGILKDFIDFCDNNNLSYFIGYGSLLGAVRHKGFIPWDDDIDLQMPREDYNKLIKIYNDMQATDQYRLISPYSKDALHSYVKIIDTRTVKDESGVRYTGEKLGIDIDVFPIDGLPDTMAEYDDLFNKIKKIYKKFVYLKSDFSGNNLKNTLLRFYQSLMGTGSNLIRKAEKMLSKYPYNNSKYVGTLASYYDYYNDRHEKENYQGYVMLKFEDIDVKAPIGYDCILKTIYGDYMKLPPEDERVTHHTYTAYWKD